MTTNYHDAPDNTAQSLAPSEVIPFLIGSTVEEVERALVVQTLARCDGNRTHAARVLGLSVRTQQDQTLCSRGRRGPCAPGRARIFCFRAVTTF